MWNIKHLLRIKRLTSDDLRAVLTDIFLLRKETHFYFAPSILLGAF